MGRDADKDKNEKRKGETEIMDNGRKELTERKEGRKDRNNKSKGMTLGTGGDADQELYAIFFIFVFVLIRCVRISKRDLDRRSVHPFVHLLVMLSSKSLKNGLLRILNDTDSAGRGKERDEEE